MHNFRLLRSDIMKPLLRKSEITKKIDGALLVNGWKEEACHTRIAVDKTECVTPTHSVDCYKNRVAPEVEWNNKDPFYDRSCLISEPSMSE